MSSGEEVLKAPSGRVPEAPERVVVVGVDGSKESSTALRWAAAEARLRRAKLTVVEAWQRPTPGFGSYIAVPPDTFEDWATVTAASLKEQVDSVVGDDASLEVLRKVAEGPPARVILEAAEGADLVVVGSRGRGGFSGLLLGSVSAQVAHHARCPVTIVREAG